MTEENDKSKVNSGTQSTAIAASVLGLLQAEMELLRAVLPGSDSAVPGSAMSLPSDEEVEEAFDNMPV